MGKVVRGVGNLQSMIQEGASSTEEMSSVSKQISGDVQSVALVSEEISSGPLQITQVSSGLETSLRASRGLSASSISDEDPPLGAYLLQFATFSLIILLITLLWSEMAFGIYR